MGEPMDRLPGLNGLRFFAALSVMICHIEQIKGFHSLNNVFHEPAISILGSNGVTFFFVLSGFLITHLLLKEQERFHDIKISKFYVRRILRIWPVYFLVTVLSFFIIPSISWLTIPHMPPVWSADFYSKLSLYLLLSAHISQAYFTDLPYGGALWSTSVEEHFYFLWPHLVKRASQNLTTILLGVIAIPVLLRSSIFWCSTEDKWLWLPIARYAFYFRLDCMAIGALGAIALRKISLAFIYRRGFQAFLFAILACHVLTGTAYAFYINDDIYALLFILLILNVATNPKSFIQLRGQIFEFMGKISYGLYAYQWLCISLVVKTVILLALPQNILIDYCLIYTGTLFLTSAVAYLSYRFIEAPFLHLKKNFI